MNSELLNAISKKIIEMANEGNILLSDHFESRDAFAQFVIGFTITSIVKHCGMSVREAYDIVMGEGAYKKLSDSIWDSLQKEQN